MSKQQPNQDFYKIGGRQQSDGVDRGETSSTQEDQPRVQSYDRNAKHPAVLRSKKK